MALSIGTLSRSILNGTQTVPLQHSHPIQRITLGLKLGNGAIVCHWRITGSLKHRMASYTQVAYLWEESILR